MCMLVRLCAAVNACTHYRQSGLDAMTTKDAATRLTPKRIPAPLQEVFAAPHPTPTVVP